MESYTKQQRVSVRYRYSNTGQRRSFDNSGNAGPNTNNYSGTYASRLDSILGYRNPNWRAQVASGQSATTPLLAQQLRTEIAPIYMYQDIVIRPKTNNTPPYQWVRFVDSTSGITSYPELPVTLPPSNALALSNARNRSLASFISACNNVRSACAAGEDTFEIRKTLSLLRSPIRTLREGILKTGSLMRNHQNKYRHRPTDALRAITDTHLEWQFGVKPTVSTVSAILADAARTRFDVYPVSASATEEYSGTTGSFYPGNQPIYSLYALNWAKKGSITYKWKGAYRSGADNNGQISRINQLRLAPRDWVPTLYNVMPWSWMIDYFTNVGDIVEGICWRRSDLVWSQFTVITKQTVTYRGGKVVLNGQPGALTQVVYNNMLSSGGNATFEQKTVSRNRVTSETSMVPSFTVKVPTNIGQYVNLAAVAVSQLASRFGI